MSTNVKYSNEVEKVLADPEASRLLVDHILHPKDGPNTVEVDGKVYEILKYNRWTGKSERMRSR